MNQVWRRHSKPLARAAIVKSIAAVLTLTAINSAMANDQGQEGSAIPSVHELDAITVTAQKRAQLIHEVPVSVSSISAESLTTQNLIQVKDFYSRVPGMSYVDAGLGQQSISLRGLTTGYTGSPAVSVVIDDVPYGSSTSVGYGGRLMPDLDPGVLDRVEVLRGPQGTLYGASSLGGLLKYVTRTPDPNALFGRAELTASKIESGGAGFGGRASVNIPIATDVMAASVSAFYREDPGYIDVPLSGVDDANSQHAYGGRAALYIRPSDQLEVHLSALTQDRKGFSAGTIDADENYRLINPDLVSTSVAALPRYSSSARLYTGRVEADLGAVALTSITGFGKNEYSAAPDSTARFAPILQSFGLPDARAFLLSFFSTEKLTQEFRLASTSLGPGHWMIGAFYTKEDTEPYQSLDAKSTSGEQLLNILTSDFPSTFEEKALFADWGYDFSDRFSLQMGARYSRNNQRYDELSIGPLMGDGDPEPLYGESSDNSFTWSLSPQYKFGDDSMVYLRAATGYRPGGPNTALPTIPPSFGPDKSMNLELGVKGTALDRTVSYAAALFRIDWDDMQLTLWDAVTQLGYFANGSGARSQGLELESTWRPTTDLTLSGNIAYTDAKLTQPLLGGAGFDVMGKPGERLPYVARLTGNLSVDQAFELGRDWLGSVGASIAYMGDRLGDLAAAPDIPRARSPGFAQYDLRGSISRDHWRIGVFVRNLTDKRGIVNTTLRTATDPGSGYALDYVLPRTFGMTVSYDF